MTLLGEEGNARGIGIVDVVRKRAVRADCNYFAVARLEGFYSVDILADDLIARLLCEFVNVAPVVLGILFVVLGDSAAAEKVELRVDEVEPDFVVVAATQIVPVKACGSRVVERYTRYNPDLSAAVARDLRDGL